MSVHELLKRIENEKNTLKQEVYNAEGLVRLQETLKNYDGEYRLVLSSDTALELKNKPHSANHKSGVPLLDDTIGGFREKQLITIGGDTGHGKTTFGIYLLNQYKALNPIFIPLEQSAEEIIEQREDRGHPVPTFWHPENLAAQVTTDWIEERIVEGIAKNNSRFVLIDHLGYIKDMTDTMKRENAAYRIGQVVRNIKNIAKKWDVIIVLLVHISQHDEGKPPNREDIKNSSDIAQESDLVGFVWRKNQQKNKVRIYSDQTMFSIQKNRRTGKNANLGFKFDNSNGYFIEDPTWVQDMEDRAKAEIDTEEAF